VGGEEEEEAEEKYICLELEMAMIKATNSIS
jgi:hypothetical protein